MNTLRANKGGADLKIRVGTRLKAAAEYVAVSSAYRADGENTIVCADVGCDHGYLSIYLIEKGICGKVYATDINSKPVEIARKNIAARDTRGLGLCEKIDVRLCDGLCGLSGLGINRVVICGMGGEVISGIIDRARSFWTPDVKFILQPMSGEAELRMWLEENGFLIEDETLVRDMGRIYTVMCVSFFGERAENELSGSDACGFVTDDLNSALRKCTSFHGDERSGNKHKYSQAELMLGRHNIIKGGQLLYELCERKLVHARNLLRQPDASESDRSLERELSELLEKMNK